MKTNKWSEENLRSLIISSISKSEVIKKLGYKGTEGGHYRTLEKYISKYTIDTSHFKGQGWRKGISDSVFTPKRPLEEMLLKNSMCSTGNLKRRLLRDNIMENICRICKLTEWQGKEIKLQLDHINGDSTDNTLGNLRLLCPNCHSQTPTYCRSKHKSNNEVRGIRTPNKRALNAIPLPVGIPPHNCAFCNKSTINPKFCSQECYHSSTKWENGGQRKSTRKVERPSKEELENKIKESSICSIGRQYGVSDNTIRKWCRYYGINYRCKSRVSANSTTSPIITSRNAV